MTPKPWSFSGIEGFRTCPRQFWHTRVARDVEETQNEVGMWGDYCHKQFEVYLKARLAGEPADLPANVADYKPYLDRLLQRPGKMYVECEYAVNLDLEFVDWMAPDVWCRAKLDVLNVCGHTAWTTDHKMGKVKDKSDQLKLAAILVFLRFPQVLRVKTSFAWLAYGKWTNATYERDDMPWLWAGFLPALREYKRAFKLMQFPPKPSGLCRGWCPVTTCEHWSPKRS